MQKPKFSFDVSGLARELRAAKKELEDKKKNAPKNSPKHVLDKLDEDLELLKKHWNELCNIDPF